MSGLTAIRTQLAANILAISGMSRVYVNTPEVAPAEDMPATIIEMLTPNFVTVTEESNQELRYYWHFRLTFLLKPAGQDNKDLADSGLEVWPKLFMDAIWADIKLHNNCNLLRATNEINGGIVDYMGLSYFGLEILLDAEEVVVTTFG